MTDVQDTATPFALETREFTFRAESVDTDEGIIRGIAVPYDSPVRIRSWFEEYDEQFAAGSVDDDGALAFWRHTDPIGYVAEANETDAGREVAMQISQTTLGRDALTLARDLERGGRPLQLSVGFEPGGEHTITERENDVPLVTRTRVRVREVSLVPFGAYGDGATVTEVRNQHTTTPKENPTMPETITAADVTEIREELQDVQRSLTVLTDRATADVEPATDTRSAGEWVRALAAGDADTIREYEELVQRAYSGGTTADGILTPQYVGDTIRLISDPNPLASIFATGQLPQKGLKLEYGVLDENTLKVERQANEGDNLETGKISVDIDYADIHTYGGAFEMTRQAIERTTNVNLLDLHWRGLALAAARQKATTLRAHYAAVVATNSSDPDRVIVVEDQTDYLDWVSGIVDAAEKYQDLGLGIDALVVDKTVFKTIASLTAQDGRPLMRVAGTGVNTVGEIAPKALGGDLAGITVRVNLRQAEPGAAFVNGEAIRQYNSSIVELSDETIVNLTKQFGLYYYGALATEIPAAILPVVDAAPTGGDEG